VSAPKNNKNAPTGESGNQRSKRRKDKLIRLDDLMPKQDVKGGHQLLFGATDTTQTTKPTELTREPEAARSGEGPNTSGFVGCLLRVTHGDSA